MGKLFGLLGHPVAHSMSAIMHNDAFSKQNLNGYYQAFDVSSDELGQAIAGIRALGISGFNVTIPHKIEVMKYLDVIDEEAKLIGAVNTVVNENGRLVGYNTDGRGYLQSLLMITGEQLKQKRVLVIGAGGASRAIVTVLADYGVQSLTITNRTTEKAHQLASDFDQNQTSIKVTSLEESEKDLQEYDVLINTTSVGMSPNVDHIPLSLNRLKKGAILSDLIYNPLKTKWLKVGEEQGAIIHNGVGMFVGQGALAFEKWTGLTPNLEHMTKIVMEQLGGNYVKR